MLCFECCKIGNNHTAKPVQSYLAPYSYFELVENCFWYFTAIFLTLYFTAFQLLDFSVRSF